MKYSLLLLLSVFTLNIAATPAGWRVDGSGRFPDATPPLTWAADTNVVWRTPLPAFGNASPVVVGDRIFVTMEPATLVCIDLADGAIRWQATNTYQDVYTADQIKGFQAEVAPKLAPLKAQLEQLNGQLAELRRKFEETKDKALRNDMNKVSRERDQIDQQMTALDPLAMPKTHGHNGYASYTPVVDAGRVYVMFGNGVVASYDLDGKRQWIRVGEKPTHGWGQSSSPIIVDGKLIVHVIDMVALDPATGNELWRARTPWGWGTPIATTLAGTPIIITPKRGDVIRATDGKVLATALGKLEFSAPVLHDGVVYFIEKGAVAVRLPATADEPFATVKLWEAKIKGDRHYGSPVIHDGLVYAISRDGWFTVLAAADGSLVYEQRVQDDKEVNNFYASVCLAGDRLYFGAMSGDSFVVQPGREYKLLATNRLEPYRTTPVFLASRLYLRTNSYLYALGQ